jgi:uncharacterized DUF497 family protein
MPQVEGFDIDPENEEEFAGHGLTAKRVLQVLENPYVIISNKQARRASHMIIGQDNGRAFLTVPMEATSNPSIWRPVTAWSSSRHEVAKFHQARRQNVEETKRGPEES